jgi:hypothetical protein
MQKCEIHYYFVFMGNMFYLLDGRIYIDLFLVTSTGDPSDFQSRLSWFCENALEVHVYAV